MACGDMLDGFGAGRCRAVRVSSCFLGGIVRCPWTVDVVPMLRQELRSIMILIARSRGLTPPSSSQHQEHMSSEHAPGCSMPRFKTPT